LLTANGLQQGPAAVKILLSRGRAQGLGLPEAGAPTLIIWARPYEPPSAAEYAGGWQVVTFSERRSTFVGRHKSLNYLFYLAARQFALDKGAKEALVLEADGLVSEGAATSLIYAKADRYFTPQAPSALPGVTVQVLARALKRRGLALEAVATHINHLKKATGLWLANSLMGLMPVSAWDGHPVPLDGQASQYLQECLAAEASL
jgi:branched-subunit amino acid aminotransferase/4-amino-4-deoxychorismate lyase